MRFQIGEPPVAHGHDFVDTVGELISAVFNVNGRVNERHVAAIDIGNPGHDPTPCCYARRNTPARNANRANTSSLPRSIAAQSVHFAPAARAS